MNKLVKAFCLTLVLSFGVSAQTSDDYNKNEFYVGYSNQRNADEDKGLNGLEISYVRNAHRYFGIKSDFSGAYRNGRFSSVISDGTNNASFSGEQRISLYNFLGGVQIKDNAADKRFKPFAHALAGVGKLTT